MSDLGVEPRNGASSNIIIRKLKERAEEISYGSLVCEFQVHKGRITQVEITSTKERIRAEF